MPRPTGIARSVSGALLVVGFAIMVAGGAIAAASQTGTEYVPPTFSARVGGVLLITAISLTLVGLVSFDLVLWSAGDRILSALGTAAYITAAISWVVATGRALVLHEWTYGLEVVFIVAAGVSMLAYGAAVIRTGAIPHWVGWLAVSWSAVWLMLFLRPHEVYPPLVPQLVPLVFGVALLSRGSLRLNRREERANR